MTLLHIDSSARQSSASRRLTTHFVETWRAAHPGDTIIRRDLAMTTLPAITDDWMATYSDPSRWTPAEHRYLALSDERGRRGLLGGRRVIVLSSRGGSYRPGTPQAAADFQEPYLRAILQFIGLTDVTFVHADNQARKPAGGESLAAALDTVTDLVNHLTQEVVSHVGIEAH